MPSFVRSADLGNSGGTTTLTVAFNYTGNLLIVFVNTGSPLLTPTVTYNGVSLNGPVTSDSTFDTTTFWLYDKSAGSQNIVITAQAGDQVFGAWAMCYDGFFAGTFVINSALDTDSVAASSYTTTFTPTGSAAWVVLCSCGDVGGAPTMTPFTQRQTNAGGDRQLGDSNALVTGSQTSTVTYVGAANTPSQAFLAFPVNPGYGWENSGRNDYFSVRRKQDYRMLAAMSKQDEQWPFTATVTPKQLGFEWKPEFARLRFRPLRDANEQWPFTAVPAPSILGWLPPDPGRPFQRYRPLLVDNDFNQPPPPPPLASFGWFPPDPLPVRIRFRPSRDADAQWVFTATPTPQQFGWDNPERFPLRIRPIPRSQLEDIQFIGAIALTPGQFGWDNPERHPFRARFRPVLSADEEWPVTVTITPGQFGWQLDPQFPLRPRPRPFGEIPELIFKPPGTPTPLNIDFAYPPEFYTERKKWQPGIYEFWQPDIPPVSPTFQTMIAAAIKERAKTGAWYITVTLQGTGAFVFTAAPAPTIFAEVLPFGSAHVVLTSGTIPVSVALAVSNDGINFVQLGPAVTNFPGMLSLNSVPSLNYPGKMPYKYHAWIVTGGDISTLLTITEVLSGWRG